MGHFNEKGKSTLKGVFKSLLIIAAPIVFVFAAYSTYDITRIRRLQCEHYNLMNDIEYGKITYPQIALDNWIKNNRVTNRDMYVIDHWSRGHCYR